MWSSPAAAGTLVRRSSEDVTPVLTSDDETPLLDREVDYIPRRHMESKKFPYPILY